MHKIIIIITTIFQTHTVIKRTFNTLLILCSCFASSSMLFSYIHVRDPFTYTGNGNKKSNNALLIRATIECPNGCKTTVESYENGIIKKIPSTLRLKG